MNLNDQVRDKKNPKRTGKVVMIKRSCIRVQLTTPEKYETIVVPWVESSPRNWEAVPS